MGDQTTRLVPALCTQCGAQIEVDPNQEAAVCKYCGTPFIVEKAINQYTSYIHVQNTYQNESNTYNVQVGKRGFAQSAFDYLNQREQRRHEAAMENQRILAEAERRRQEEEAQRTERRRKGWATFGKVLLWIYFFPIMMTIFLVKNEKLDKRVKIGLIAAVWLLTIILFAANRNNRASEAATAPPARSTAAASATATPKPSATAKPSSTATTTPSPQITVLRAGAFESETRTEHIDCIEYKAPLEWRRDDENTEGWIYYYPEGNNDVIISVCYMELSDEIDINTFSDNDFYVFGDSITEGIGKSDGVKSCVTERGRINERPVTIVKLERAMKDRDRNVTSYFIPVHTGLANVSVNAASDFEDPYGETELAILASIRFYQGVDDEKTEALPDETPAPEEPPQEDNENHSEPAAYLRGVAGKDLFDRIVAGETPDVKDDYGDNEFYIYGCYISGISVEIDTYGKLGRPIIIEVMDMLNTGDTRVFHKVLETVFNGDDFAAVTKWFDANAGAEADIKIGDANVLLRRTVSGAPVLYIVDDDYLDWV